MFVAAFCVFALHRSIKKKHQSAADVVVAYGIEALGDIDYECRVGIALLVDRAELRHAWRILTGIGAAFAECMPLAWFEAITDSTEEAETMRAIFETARRDRESECQYQP